MKRGKCARCGEDFVDRSPGQVKRFCSDRCRRRMWVADPSSRICCRDCGGPTGHTPGQRGADRCLSCRRAYDRVRVAERGHELERLWAEGWTFKEIAFEFGWTLGHLSREMDRMRRRGFDLPYRYRPSKPRHFELKQAA